jgi:hypothetical protein
MPTLRPLWWRSRQHHPLDECDEGDGAVTPASHMQTNDAQERDGAYTYEFDIRLTEEDIGA